MALINCSECSAKISSIAKQCPKCGAPNIIEKPAEQAVPEEVVPEKIASKQEQLTKKKNSGTKVILFSIGILVLIGAITFYIKNQGPSGEELEAIHSIEQNSTKQVDAMFDSYENKEKTRQDSIRLADSVSAMNTLAAEENAHPKRKSSADRKKYLRDHWRDFIKVTRSSFTYREAGGIWDLYIVATNNTEFTIDNISVSIGYIKKNGQVYKSEEINTGQIPPHSTTKTRAPNSDRGTRVSEPGIMLINSNQMNFCFAEGNWIKNDISSDPYKCK